MNDLATVLIVEDEFAIADLLEMALSDEGYRVLVAGNGREGLQRLAEGPRPDLIISDYMMPFLDGAGMIEAMRQNEALRGIPYIVMSSMPESRVRERFDGYAALVRKPFRLTAVLELVGTILAGPKPGA